MAGKRKAVVVDIDGTISDCTQRLPFITGPKKDWDAFHAASDKDVAYPWCVKLVNDMQLADMSLVVIFLSGRPEKYREQTMKWLQDNVNPLVILGGQVYLSPPSAQGMANHDFKKQAYENVIRDRYDVIFAVDDDMRVCRMWRDLGVTALHCSNWGG